jgi:hypothetical protein
MPPLAPEVPEVRVAAIGELVLYVPREMFVLHKERGLRLEPHPAIVTRVNYGKDSEPTGLVGLIVFNPELGAVVVHDVAYSAEPKGDHYIDTLNFVDDRIVPDEVETLTVDQPFAQ